MPRKPKNSGKSPSIQFYVKDWLSDPRLKNLSFEDKGVWIDLICASYLMEVPGVFWLSKRPMKKPEILRQIGAELTAKRSFNRIILTKVIKRFSADGEYPGAFYVKRVYRDTKLREARRAAGKRGGNPNLLNQKGNQNPPSSSSSSSSNPYTPLAKNAEQEQRRDPPRQPNPVDAIDRAMSRYQPASYARECLSGGGDDRGDDPGLPPGPADPGACPEPVDAVA